MDIKFTQATGYFGLTGIPHYQPIPTTGEQDVLVHRLVQVEFTCDWMPLEFQDRFETQIRAAFTALYTEYQTRAEEG
jgi:hypothetical protein